VGSGRDKEGETYASLARDVERTPPRWRPGLVMEEGGLLQGPTTTPGK